MSLTFLGIILLLFSPVLQNIAAFLSRRCHLYSDRPASQLDTDGGMILWFIRFWIRK